MADEKEEAIDGDKLIQFINAVKNVGKILEQLNVIDLRKAFVVGKKVECVETIISIEKQWKECIGEIVKKLREAAVVHEECAKDTRQMMQLAKTAQAHFNSSEFETAHARLQSFTDLCDRLQKHSDSGLLKIISEMK